MTDSATTRSLCGGATRPCSGRPGGISGAVSLPGSIGASRASPRLSERRTGPRWRGVAGLASGQRYRAPSKAVGQSRGRELAGDKRPCSLVEEVPSVAREGTKVFMRHPRGWPHNDLWVRKMHTHRAALRPPRQRTPPGPTNPRARPEHPPGRALFLPLFPPYFLFLFPPPFLLVVSAPPRGWVGATFTLRFEASPRGHSPTAPSGGPTRPRSQTG